LEAELVAFGVPHDDPVLVGVVEGAELGGAEADQAVDGGVDLASRRGSAASKLTWNRTTMKLPPRLDHHPRR